MNRCLLIGYGSIGKRHLNNLISLGYDDIVVVSRFGNSFPEMPKFKLYNDLQDAISENEISHAFVCTPTAQHFSDLKILLENSIPNIYLEKPISHNLEQLENIQPLLSNCKRLVVGYDLHFDPGLQNVKTILDSGDLGNVYSINAFVGQYLPDWRPHEDHRKGMSASIEKGGGVLLDLIHEFDYIRWLMGKPELVACAMQNTPQLAIETEDIADVLLKFDGNTSATIHLDYHQRKLIRNCVITCEKGTVIWDLVKSEVKITRSANDENIMSYQGFERNQRYIEILKVFLNPIVFDNRLTTFEEGLVSLKMVLAAKESAVTNRFITIN